MSHWLSDWRRVSIRLRAVDDTLRFTPDNLRDTNAHYGQVLGLARSASEDAAERRRYQCMALASALELEAALDVAGVARLGRPDERAAAVAAAGRSAALFMALARP